MCLKFMPNGFTQKRSGCSGSRTVMCPATPSSNPNRRTGGTRRQPLLAVQPLVLDGVERREVAEVGQQCSHAGNVTPQPCGRYSVRSASAGRMRAADRGRQRRQQVGEQRSRPARRAAPRRSASGGTYDDREVVGEPPPDEPTGDDAERHADHHADGRDASSPATRSRCATGGRVKPIERSTARSGAGAARSSRARARPSRTRAARRTRRARAAAIAAGRGSTTAVGSAAGCGEASPSARRAQPEPRSAAATSRPAPTSRAGSPRSRSGRACSGPSNACTPAVVIHPLWS